MGASPTENNMKKVLWVIIAIAAIAGILKWSAWRDAKLEVAVEKYVACVKVEYHTDPASYYNEHGQYPEVHNCEVDLTTPENTAEVGPDFIN